MLTSTERRRLVSDHLSLVQAIARRVHRSTGRRFEIEELVSIGTEGLLQAAERYDGRAEATFVTFAYYRIRGAMLDAIGELAPLSCHFAFRTRRAARAYAGGGDSSDADTLPDELIDRRRAAALLDRALATLPAKKRRLLRRCYYEDRSLKDAGRELGVSRSWASRLHADALRQLRETLAHLAA